MAEREKRVRRWAAICAALTLAAFTTACTGVQANTIQVGSPLSASFSPYPFAGPICNQLNYCDLVTTPITMVPTQLRDGANPASPVDGTVISYRLASADGTFAIQVIRSVVAVPAPDQIGEGRSLSTSVPARTFSRGGVSEPVATNLAIKKGDWVGIRNFSSAAPAFSDYLGGDFVGLGFGLIWYPPLHDGGPPRVRNSENDEIGAEIGMQATVRYCRVPKLKGKSPKAARKALAAADCRVGKVKKTNKVRDEKRVVSQGVKPGKAVSDTKPIKLGVSRKQG